MLSLIGLNGTSLLPFVILMVDFVEFFGEVILLEDRLHFRLDDVVTRPQVLPLRRLVEGALALVGHQLLERPRVGIHFEQVVRRFGRELPKVDGLVTQRLGVA